MWEETISRHRTAHAESTWISGPGAASNGVVRGVVGGPPLAESERGDPLGGDVDGRAPKRATKKTTTTHAAPSATVLRSAAGARPTGGLDVNRDWARALRTAREADLARCSNVTILLQSEFCRQRPPGAMKVDLHGVLGTAHYLRHLFDAVSVEVVQSHRLDLTFW